MNKKNNLRLLASNPGPLYVGTLHQFSEASSRNLKRIFGGSFVSEKRKLFSDEKMSAKADKRSSLENRRDADYWSFLKREINCKTFAAATDSVDVDDNDRDYDYDNNNNDCDHNDNDEDNNDYDYHYHYDYHNDDNGDNNNDDDNDCDDNDINGLEDDYNIKNDNDNDIKDVDDEDNCKNDNDDNGDNSDVPSHGKTSFLRFANVESSKVKIGPKRKMCQCCQNSEIFRLCLD